ncbi:enoyl-CoA hydratase [Variovorax paradoxus]|jgi:enoyl-CoA hydratase/carnithine racemase|uniref:enoyl-CoA hydratase/isomerase family protein n=1 Tax=Variovorax TaxID=34072 RepID=UPI0006E60788|nr:MULTISPECIES: enoyl-CoA hydratase/isomerase family protein [unclassified Variovorax]KPU98457.1 enoyl-CoA hydratase [Variovorax paradoxus]KPV11870.1 enoyl-CoA hydratase [Variovorax paradoxus]KPV13910.1 enoyl-CoA hydratase [Variovorax paradoxus]KPV25389.1 enoyl-CoA hydratase [Variovorax paradoxus]KPV35674.1 enoyl-CoA hydratase [Variovorax paradoxus]
MNHILFEVRDRVATLILNRPEKLNAVTPEMADALVAHVKDCNARADVRAVVITGAGEKAFCAGSDIAELDGYDTPWTFRNRPDYCDAIRALRKPVVCAINGYALGGGLETAMSCDIRIAAEHARFGAPEVKLGWIGGGGMSYMLAHSIGASNTALMLMGGDPIGAQQALQWGLVSELVPAAELLARAQAIAATIASRPPIAVETAKANLRAAYAMPLETAIQYERDLQTVCFATEDAKEGRAAFKARRPAVFEGR